MMLPDPILVIAYSARMVAQLAHQAGAKVLVIDCFADCDTQAVAAAFIQIPSLALVALQPAVENLIARFAVADVLYGSGFESYPESLDYLCNRLNLLGNPPETNNNLANKPIFFKLLEQLEIPYPPSQFLPPGQSAGWLVKPMQGQGGNGIRFYRPDDHKPRPGEYYQQLQKGTAYSVFFVADGQNVYIIGFNKQWTVAANSAQAFTFAGISATADILPAQQAQVRAWLAKLVPVLALKGLNTLDFIQDGRQLYLLEINPRLSASVQLYSGNWLIHHINALNGKLPNTPYKHNGYRGYQIVYADKNVRIPDFFPWPKHCCDIPPAGALIRKGQPICSIIAHQTHASLLMQALQSLQHHLLTGLYHYGIHR